MESGRGTVLVTGGSGYLAGWCIVQLLEQGYSVRTTVRSASREADVRAAVGTQVDPGERLAFVVADLEADAGWAEAAAGCQYVLHVASPFPPAQPKDPDELIVPARDGALRVIGAALDAGVSRVVMTSSVAAVRHGHEPPASGVYTEVDWSDPDDTSLTPYTRSKTVAELAAWELVRSRGAEDKLATVCPGAIIGPALSADASYSLQVVERLLKGFPAAPRLGFAYVDVRDVADLHIRAMTDPAAGGQRFLAVDEFLWMVDVGRVLRDRLGDAAKKVPTRVAPNVLVRLMAIFDPEIRTVVSDLGEKSDYSADKAKQTLGWSPRPVEDSIAECGQSLIDLGVV
jgi:nucleoside-diphosphate-sugar epimerase